MTRCLSCEIHCIFRIVLAFSKEAIIAGRHVPVLESFKMMPNANMIWEKPELSKRSMKGGVATIIVDTKMENSQKKVILRVAKAYKNLIISLDKFGGMLDEGFIEIHKVSDVVELIDWEEKPKCKTKKRREIGVDLE